MMDKGIEREFAERVFDQIRGFGEYGFPESHAASFALIAYCTAWLKCHHPDVFACALLNAWPMGFYSPASIVEDARRHGIEVRPIDILASQWECTLEPGLGRTLAVRMGLRYVKGLGEADWEAIQKARRRHPADVAGFVSESGLDEGALSALASCGALRSLGADRRQALWEVSGTSRRRDGESASEGLDLPAVEMLPEFAALTDFQEIAWDYDASSHSTRGHPLEPYRARLTRRGLPDAQALAEAEDGSRRSYAGMVICRQRPGTAGGVVFMTLEDESGFVNLVVWSKVFEEYRRVILTHAFLGVTGTIQSRDGIVHLIAESFWKPELSFAPPAVASRDFH
jgi:error-prone DNA polymerase